MTLHWWMHWFWVTALLAFSASSIPAIAAPQSEELQHITTDVEDAQQKYAERQGRAMYFKKTTPISINVKTTPPSINTTEANRSEEVHDISNTTAILNVSELDKTELNDKSNNLTMTNVTASNINHLETNKTDFISANSTLATTSTTTAKPPNATTPISKKRNLTRPDYVKDGGDSEGVSESRIVTEKPLSLETSFLQTRIPPNIESSRRVKDPVETGMDTGAIAGISFAAVALTALSGSMAFVLYRRRYLNKPQTLNDKCSNPDSSGYLDDSTIRDNSEEMYSLDNDSFLNSLEAMTIQNYWTDTVKHTKL